MSAAPHASLLTLLRCLDREDVLALRLCSDQVAVAARASGDAPLTRVPLSVQQIEALVANTPMGEALARNAGALEALQLAIEGRPLRVALSRRQGVVQLSIARGEAGGAAAQAIPAPIVAAPLEPHAEGVQAAALAEAALAAAVAAATAASMAAGPVLTAVPPTSELGGPPARWAADASHAAPTAPAPAGGGDLGDAAALASLDGMVLQARAALASDVHLTPDEPPRWRVAGALRPVGAPPPGAWLQELALALVGERRRDQLMAHGYVDLAVTLPRGGRLRANVSRHPRGAKICLRLVPAEVPTLQSLGLPDELAGVTRYHQGLAVVAGPMGHGKTATLAALIDRINGHAAHHIIVVEDPIEVVHPVRRALISQREVGAHTRSYARALKAALREDPDVIVIGELRDRETVEIALSAAETGHLVLATMNTRSAAKAIDRLIDLFPPEEQAQVRATLAGALKMVIAQRLLPRIGGGQVAAVELITGSVPLWALIRDNKLFQLPSLQQRGRSAGMIRLDASLLELVRAGAITAESARAVAQNLSELDRQLAGTPPGTAS